MKEAIIATHNPGKVKEFKEILEPRGYDVKSLAEIGFTEEIEETGHTFEENAIMKAEAVAKAVNKMVIADDSGLSIDNLGGRPGVYSARYAGEQKDDQANIEKVLSELKGIEKEQRTARFRCALAVSIPGEETKTVEGHVEGYIAEEPRGEYGFGYDPIFIVKDKDKTMAELTSDEKNKISHRADALKKLSKLACPNVNSKSKFMGPAPMSQVRLFNAHPTGAMNKSERLEALMDEGGLADCGNSQNCVQSCPKGIPLTTSIAALNRDTNLQAFRNFFGSDRV